MSERPVNDYFQLGNSTPTNGSQPNKEKNNDSQLVDLDEYYETDHQTDKTEMVTGTEQFFNLGVLSKRCAQLYGLKGLSRYEPTATARNAQIAGNEGFFDAIKKGFETFIESVIKYIKMAVKWITGVVKTILGLNKSERQIAEIEKKLPALKEEFKHIMVGMGFPAEAYDMEEFIGNLPNNRNRSAQFSLLKAKVHDDTEAVESLNKVLPLFQQCLTSLKKISDNTGRQYNKFRADIKDAARSVKSGRTDGQAERTKLSAACLELEASLDVSGVQEDINKLYKELYGISFDNASLEKGFMNAKKLVADQTVAVEVRVSQQNFGRLYPAIEASNKRYIELVERKIDVSNINFDQFEDIISRSDAEIIAEVDALASSSAQDGNAGKLLSRYQHTSISVRNFVTLNAELSRLLMIVKQQCMGLCKWKIRMEHLLQAYILDDVETIAKQFLAAKAEGKDVQLNDFGIPSNLAIMTGEHAQTVWEHFSGMTQEAIKTDLLGMKTAVNKLSTATGWGNLL